MRMKYGPSCGPSGFKRLIYIVLNRNTVCQSIFFKSFEFQTNLSSKSPKFKQNNPCWNQNSVSAANSDLFCLCPVLLAGLSYNAAAKALFFYRNELTTGTKVQSSDTDATLSLSEKLATVLTQPNPCYIDQWAPLVLKKTRDGVLFNTMSPTGQKRPTNEFIIHYTHTQGVTVSGRFAECLTWNCNVNHTGIRQRGAATDLVCLYLIFRVFNPLLLLVI